jgi:hypothetical protein
MGSWVTELQKVINGLSPLQASDRHYTPQDRSYVAAELATSTTPTRAERTTHGCIDDRSRRASAIDRPTRTVARVKLRSCAECIAALESRISTVTCEHHARYCK